MKLSRTNTYRVAARRLWASVFAETDAPWDSTIRAVLFIVSYATLAARLGSRLIISGKRLSATPLRRELAELSSANEICAQDADRLLRCLSPLSRAELESVVGYSVADGVFDEDDSLSWLYQSLKRDLANKAFRDVLGGQSKLSDRNLLFTTQFFTDRYMVDFLVNRCLSLVTKGALTEIRVVDPACGGGNFLLAAFDALWSRSEDKSEALAKWLVERC